MNIVEIVTLQLRGHHVPENTGIDKQTQAAVCKLERVFHICYLAHEADSDIIILEIAAERAACRYTAGEPDKRCTLEIAQIHSFFCALHHGIVFFAGDLM